MHALNNKNVAEILQIIDNREFPANHFYSSNQEWWNNGMLEWWNVGNRRLFSIHWITVLSSYSPMTNDQWPMTVLISSSPPTHYPPPITASPRNFITPIFRTHYSIFPTFHHSSKLRAQRAKFNAQEFSFYCGTQLHAPSPGGEWKPTQTNCAAYRSPMPWGKFYWLSYLFPLIYGFVKILIKKNEKI
jgi:hypothetical protein